MQFHVLLGNVPEVLLVDQGDVAISSIAYDSRLVQPGGLFVAMRGFHADG
ncbi:MAG: UDP-N-acetylmuramoyl-L-alanyl-D-glutamate--2,6-diaminopimelate ligase, partial [Roseiflexaceae bacterium]|nr:UDP-N-acetylmuramoyl-L-alanyl-D-glutamate--2,6-diaminopimelate ligase [Roseiflexaceae bacterium]